MTSDQRLNFGAPLPVSPPRRRLSTPLIVAAVLVPVLLVVTFVGVGNWWVKNQELNSLLTRTQVSEHAMDAFGKKVMGLVADYNNEELAAGPLYDQVKVACVDGASRVEDSGTQISAVHVLPWHRALRDARSAYLKHNHAWSRLLRACASDPSVLNNQGKQVDIAVTWRAVCRNFRNAVPPFALHNESARVRKTFNMKAGATPST